MSSRIYWHQGARGARAHVSHYLLPAVFPVHNPTLTKGLLTSLIPVTDCSPLTPQTFHGTRFIDQTLYKKRAFCYFVLCSTPLTLSHDDASSCTLVISGGPGVCTVFCAVLQSETVCGNGCTSLCCCQLPAVAMCCLLRHDV